jgi:hypothetical protein
MIQRNPVMSAILERWHPTVAAKAELLSRLAQTQPDDRPSIRQGLAQVRIVRRKLIAKYREMVPLYWTGQIEE